MKRMKGFTLTEVIITMIIIVILSLVSMPIYKGRFSNQAKLAEGYALLGAIKDAQINYYNEYGNFLCCKNSYAQSLSTDAYLYYTSADPVLGINAINNKYFTSFNYDMGNVGYSYWKYCFCVKVKSAKAGTITQIFNLTERHEIAVINGSTDLSI